MGNKGDADKASAILGAGITGLTAAYVLNRRGAPVKVFESEGHVGGASRTVRHGDFRFDLGGHHFYTKNRVVLSLVQELLGDELLAVPRRSRICLKGKFVNYPLTFFNALLALGPFWALAAAGSYGLERIRQVRHSPPDETFEEWVVSRFGRRLYEIYFKPYSEKVWGVPCSELRADFAAQRIKGLSFREAVRNMVCRRDDAVPSLIRQFYYPRLGFGRIPEAMLETLEADAVELNSPVVRLEHDGKRVRRVVCRREGAEQSHEVDQIISTIPMDRLVRSLSPSPPVSVLEAAGGLRYRDLIIVFLALDCEQVTPDQWVYFSDEEIFFGRMHEPKNWSPAMAPEGKTSLAVEVFCFENEPVWSEAEESLIEHVARGLAELGLIRKEEVTGGCVARVRKAYPLYVGGYEKWRSTILDFLNSIENLQTAGRNGLFRYTSSDYYMEMGMKAALNVLGDQHDLMRIAAAQEYAES